MQNCRPIEAQAIEGKHLFCVEFTAYNVNEHQCYLSQREEKQTIEKNRHDITLKHLPIYTDLPWHSKSLEKDSQLLCGGCGLVAVLQVGPQNQLQQTCPTPRKRIIKKKSLDSICSHRGHDYNNITRSERACQYSTLGKKTGYRDAPNLITDKKRQGCFWGNLSWTIPNSRPGNLT